MINYYLLFQTLTLLFKNKLKQFSFNIKLYVLHYYFYSRLVSLVKFFDYLMQRSKTQLIMKQLKHDLNTKKSIICQQN